MKQTHSSVYNHTRVIVSLISLQITFLTIQGSRMSFFISLIALMLLCFVFCLYVVFVCLAFCDLSISLPILMNLCVLSSPMYCNVMCSLYIVIGKHKLGRPHEWPLCTTETLFSLIYKTTIWIYYVYVNYEYLYEMYMYAHVFNKHYTVSLYQSFKLASSTRPSDHIIMIYLGQNE